MQAAGLITLCISEHGIDSTNYLKKIDQEMNQKKSGDLKRLTLVGLSGLYLKFGCSLAIVAFIVEIVHGYMLKNKTNNKRKAPTDAKSNELNESDHLPQENRSGNEPKDIGRLIETVG